MSVKVPVVSWRNRLAMPPYWVITKSSRWSLCNPARPEGGHRRWRCQAKSTVRSTRCWFSLPRNWLRLPVPVATNRSWSPSLSKSDQVAPCVSAFGRLRQGTTCGATSMNLPFPGCETGWAGCDDYSRTDRGNRRRPDRHQAPVALATVRDTGSVRHVGECDLCEATDAPRPSAAAAIADSEWLLCRRRMFNRPELEPGPNRRCISKCFARARRRPSAFESKDHSPPGSTLGSLNVMSDWPYLID